MTRLIHIAIDAVKKIVVIIVKANNSVRGTSVWSKTIFIKKTMTKATTKIIRPPVFFSLF